MPVCWGAPTATSFVQRSMKTTAPCCVYCLARQVQVPDLACSGWAGAEAAITGVAAALEGAGATKSGAAVMTGTAVTAGVP